MSVHISVNKITPNKFETSKRGREKSQFVHPITEKMKLQQRMYVLVHNSITVSYFFHNIVLQSLQYTDK